MGFGSNSKPLSERGNIIGRTLKTLSEHNEATPDELVLEDGERVLIHATEKGIHVGCVTLTFKAAVGLRNKLSQLLTVHQEYHPSKKTDQ